MNAGELHFHLTIRVLPIENLDFTQIAKKKKICPAHIKRQILGVYFALLEF